MGTPKGSVVAEKKDGPVLGLQLKTGPLIGPYPAGIKVADIQLPGAGEFTVRMFSDLATFNEAQGQSGPWFTLRNPDDTAEGCFSSLVEAQRQANGQQRMERRFTHQEVQSHINYQVYTYRKPDGGLYDKSFHNVDAVHRVFQVAYPGLSPHIESFKSRKLFLAAWLTAWNEQEAKRPKTVKDLVCWLKCYFGCSAGGSAVLLPQARLAKFFNWKKMTAQQEIDQIDTLAKDLQKEANILAIGHDDGLLVFPFPVKVFDQDITCSPRSSY